MGTTNNVRTCIALPSLVNYGILDNSFSISRKLCRLRKMLTITITLFGIDIIAVASSRYEFNTIFYDTTAEMVEKCRSKKSLRHFSGILYKYKDS